MKKIVYVIGSLRNPRIPHIGNDIRNAGFEAADYWWSAGCHCGCGHSADESWTIYSKIREQSYKEAIYDYAAQNIFNFDLFHLNRADAGVMVMPAGKAAHMEFGYLRGRNKPVFILFEEAEPERGDIMHGFATDIFFSVEALIETLKKL